MTDDYGMITIVGYISMRPIGSSLRISGEEVSHKKYGSQFAIKRILDTDIDYSNNMDAYLRSGAIAHIGPKTAEKIIEVFGDETYDIFKENPERLLEVPGIGEKTLSKIMDSFNSKVDIMGVTMELCQYGISEYLANKLFHQYGEGIIDMVKENPYILISSKVGIGFKTADSIALEAGVKRNDSNRIEAAMVYLLERSINEGNTYMPMDLLKKQTEELLEIELEDMEEVIYRLSTNRMIKLVNHWGDMRAYNNSLENGENIIAYNLVSLKRYPREMGVLDIPSRINMIEKLDGIEFGENQRRAIEEAFSSRVLVITGGPGTGKTTIINAVLRIAEEMGLSYALAAPTGRAAQRITETTGTEASTIHRLLEYQFNGESMEFSKNEKNPLEQRMIIIDEMSMVDTYLLSELVKALKEDTRLVLIGDINQIPSVGPGNVLKDIIDSGLINIVRLENVYRQAEESTIIKNAHRINRGLPPLLNEKNSDFFMLDSQSEAQTLETIKSLVMTRLPEFYNLDPLRDIQILAPMKKGLIGVDNLNKELQDTLNPKDPTRAEIKYMDTIFRENDKVMQTKNNYQIEWKSYTEEGIEYDSGLGVYNGDIGFVEEIDTVEQSVKVKFYEKTVEYRREDLSQLELAYGITIHKSQGSEFPVVIIPVHYTPWILGNRNLVYTAITRAKSLVVLVGKRERLVEMINNTFLNKRYTSLDEKLIYFERLLKYED